MSNYLNFAYLYDQLMADVPYDSWIDYVEQILEEFKVTPKRVLDLACGTGNTTLPWAKRGYEVIGLDQSETMLEIARMKAKSLKIDFVQGDMRRFILPEQVDLAVSLYDSLNYLLEAQDIQYTLDAVCQALVPNGLFIFDMNTQYKLEQVEDDIFFWEGDCGDLIWKQKYDKRDGIWSIELIGYVRGDNGYVKFKELHREKAYPASKVEEMANRAGFEVLGVYEAYKLSEPSPVSSRIFYVLKKGD